MGVLGVWEQPLPERYCREQDHEHDQEPHEIEGPLIGGLHTHRGEALKGIEEYAVRTIVIFAASSPLRPNS